MHQRERLAMHTHVLHAKQGRRTDDKARSTLFNTVAQINRQLGVHRAACEALITVNRDGCAESPHRRVLAEIVEKIDERTAIATLTMEELTELTVCLEWPQGLSEWDLAQTLKDLVDWGYLVIDWRTRRFTIAQSLDAHTGGAQ
jgi:hypothetical protein